MKTITGNAFSTKPISLSKAAKFLSNFVSSENGASRAINAYLHRASASFNELKKVHKDLNSSYSAKKHKRHGPEASHVSEAIGENPIRSLEISQERSKNKSRRHQFQSNTVEDEEKPAQSVVEFSQEPNDVVRYNESGSEKHKKKKNREVKSGDHPERKDEGKLTTKSEESLAWDVESGQEQGNGGRNIMGMDEGKKHKGEKKKKKEKDSISNISQKEAEIDNLEGKGTMGTGNQKGTEKKPYTREVENGGLVDTQELHSKKKKRYEAGSEKINTQEEKREQKTKRKNEEVEDRTEESTRRRKRRKREGDD